MIKAQIPGGYSQSPTIQGVQLNSEKNMFLTAKDASDAVVLYWKGDPEVRRTNRLGQWVMNTFFPGNVDDRLYYEHCHSCAAQVICETMVEDR